MLEDSSASLPSFMVRCFASKGGPPSSLNPLFLPTSGGRSASVIRPLRAERQPGYLSTFDGDNEMVTVSQQHQRNVQRKYTYKLSHKSP